MNIQNKIAVATLSALYAAGVGATAADITPTMQGKDVLWPQQVTAPEGYNPNNKPQVSAADRRAQRIRSTVGTNRHVTATGKRSKFFAEEGLAEQGYTYIIQLHEAPVATYQGGVQGLHATSVRQNPSTQTNKLFVRGQAAIAAIPAYQDFLIQKQQAVVAVAQQQGLTLNIRKNYVNAINGFSVEMTPSEAERLSQLADVKYVARSKMYELTTYRGPEMIGAGAAWSGEATGTALKGEGVIVGVIDTGINTDHVSFAAVGDDGYQHINPWGDGVYIGDCSLEEFENMCNDKLIGVRSYPVVTDSYEGLMPAHGEDYQGHGSHTAGTSAGNVLFDVEYTLPAAPDAEGKGNGAKSGKFLPRISGVAPHSNIIAYQACTPMGCPGEAILASIEDAIVDGVDVINFSISGSDTNPWNSATEMAFLSAHEAGIVVSASAGNSGPGYSTAMHPSPWLMTVAASTSDHAIDLSHDLTVTPTTDHWSKPSGPISGGGLSPEFSGKLTSGPRALGLDYATESWGGSDAWKDAQFCRVPFPVGTFQADEIVICKRDNITSGDGIARTIRADNAAAGGAGGFILYNYSNSDSIAQDNYAIPGIHIERNEGNNLFNYISQYALAADGDVLATIGETSLDIVEQTGNVVAEFSGRGPSQAVPEHLIPSISGPGVDIYAPYIDHAPFGGAVSDWTHMSGTSMSAPHLAGAAALIKQAHPDWTPAQIISAIMTTADETGTASVSQWTDEVAPVDTYFVGSGIVNIDKAIRAGLTLDETPDNFGMANPDNGGLVRNLNLAELVNYDCSFRGCTWVREVTGTVDSAWQVSGVMADQTVQINATPAEFFLKAGETKAIQLSMSFSDTQTAWGGSDGIEVRGRVAFTPVDATGSVSETIPKAHLPVSMAMKASDLPNEINVIAKRNDGKQTVSGLVTRESSDLTVRSYAPVKATQLQLSLPQVNLGAGWLFKNQTPYDVDGNLIDGLHQSWLTVDEGARRLMAEVVSMDATTVPESQFWMTFDPFVHVGIDRNNDGIIDYENELVCISNNDTGNRRATEAQSITNWCNLNEPEAGNYWVLFENIGYFPEETSTFTVAMGVVSAEQSPAINIDAPSSITGGTPFSIDVNWDLDMQEGDRYYGALDVGSAAVNAGDLANVAVNIVRDRDEVFLKSSQDHAKLGDIITLTLDVAENVTGGEREFELNATLPEGMTIVPGSLKSAGQFLPATITAEDNAIVVAGIQQTSHAWDARYEVTTSENDPMCHMPLDINPTGGYIDAASFYGYLPLIGGDAYNAKIGWGGSIGDEWFFTGVTLPFSWLYGPGATQQMYANAKYAPNKAMHIFPNGVIEMGMEQDAFLHYDAPINFNLEGNWTMPYGVDALASPFWKGAQVTWGWFGPEFSQQAYTPLNTELDFFSGGDPLANLSGITLITYNDGRVLVEWDKMRSGDVNGSETVFVGPESWRYVYPATYADNYDDNYDFEVMFEVGEYRYGKGEFEMIYAYKDINQGSAEDLVTAGVWGYKGPRNAVAPIDGYKKSEFAYNNAAEVIKNDLMVCYDYVGPESTRFTVQVDVQVGQAAVGQDNAIQFISMVDGLPDSSVVSVVAVNSNIKVYAIADQIVAENGAVNVDVVYLDNEDDANNITVTGDNVSATIAGHAITLTPDANWHGETQVTVTVADAIYANDSATTSFMLTVTSDGIELGCMDSAAVNFDTDANSDDGSCTYPAEEEVETILGCMDSTATNFDATANSDDGSCSYPAEEEGETILGCMDSIATNFDATANSDDGSCTFAAPIVEPDEKSSGGSMPWLMLILMPLVMSRRRKK